MGFAPFDFLGVLGIFGVFSVLAVIYLGRFLLAKLEMSP
jgi:hypothetical protein